MAIFWELTTASVCPFFCLINLAVFLLQCCKKKKGRKATRRRGRKMPAKEKERSAEAKKGKKNGSNDKTPKASTLAKLKEKKDEKETPTALSSEHQSDNEGPPKSKTKTTGGIFTNSDNSTPTAIMPIVGEFGGERKVSAVLTALTEKEKKEAEKKFPMEEDIDDHPDYDTLQYADKKDVFKTGFTSKGVRIEKEEPKMKLRPGDSAYLDD